MESQPISRTETNAVAATPAAVLIPLVPAALFYAAFLACLNETYSTSFGGGGGEARLAEDLLNLWTIASSGLLWIMLGIQLWVGRNARGIPAWAGKTILALYLLSGPAAIFAVATMYSYVAGWSGLVPALLPPLIAVYGTWAGLEKLHGMYRAEAVAGVLVAPVALLIVATVPLSLLDGLEAPRNAARLKAQRDAAEAKKVAELQQADAEARARYQNLTADSPLADYLRYVSDGDDEDMMPRRC